MVANGTYCVISEWGKDFRLFMGNGTRISAKGFTITATEKASVVLACENGRYFFTTDRPAVIQTASGRKLNVAAAGYEPIRF